MTAAELALSKMEMFQLDSNHSLQLEIKEYVDFNPFKCKAEGEFLIIYSEERDRELKLKVNETNFDADIPRVRISGWTSDEKYQLECNACLR